METGASKPYAQVIVVQESPEAAIQQLTTAAAGTPGYTVTPTGPNSVVLNRSFIPQWAIIVAIVGALLCLIGLLALLVKEQEALTITATPTEGGARVEINGAAKPALIAALGASIAGMGGSAQPAAQPAAAAAPASTSSAAPPSPAAWHPDPAGRHEQRYWDGNAWTDHVMDKGQPGSDPPPK